LTLPNDVRMSRECISFINHCLTYNSHKRPNWEDLKNHKFLNGTSGRHKNRENSEGNYKTSGKRSGSSKRSPIIPESVICTS